MSTLRRTADGQTGTSSSPQHGEMGIPPSRRLPLGGWGPRPPQVPCSVLCVCLRGVFLIAAVQALVRAECVCMCVYVYACVHMCMCSYVCACTCTMPPVCVVLVVSLHPHSIASIRTESACLLRGCGKSEYFFSFSMQKRITTFPATNMSLLIPGTTASCAGPAREQH